LKEPPGEEIQGDNELTKNLEAFEDMYIPDIQINEPQESSQLDWETILDCVDQPNVAQSINGFVANPISDPKQSGLEYGPKDVQNSES
jgi:hypothetical protein